MHEICFRNRFLCRYQKKKIQKLIHKLSFLLVYCLPPKLEYNAQVSSNSLWPQGLYSPWNSPGKNTGVGSLSLLQGIFPTQGSNLGLLNCRCILYQLSHKGCPRILEWVAYTFSSGSSRPRNWTRVSCIAGRFFTNSAIREALNLSCNIRAGGMAEHRAPAGPNMAL